MKKIKIFLASSEELKEERLELAGLIGHINYALEKCDVKLYLVKWEYLDASMSQVHKQEEYNKKLEECDICIVLFWTRFGKYTKTELDTAFQKKKEGSLKKLYVAFKDSADNETPELAEFKSTFGKEYGLPYSTFHNAHELKLEFLRQFDDIQKELLDNRFPISFTTEGVYLNSEKLINA